MKKIILLAFVLSFAVIACKTEKKEEKAETVETKEAVKSIADATYNVNVEASTLKWKGFKPTGTHYGTFLVKEGTIDVKDGNISGGKFTFDMNSITVDDIPADDEYNAKLNNHLRSADFFDVENNPTSTFEITSVEGDNVKGNLTVKGITKPIEFAAKFEPNENGVTFSSETFKVDRTEFDIQYKSKKFFDNLKDKFINDEFEISFNVKASK
jgi:polyisoprenoid-binding protein YceI